MLSSDPISQCNSEEFYVWVALCHWKEFRVGRLTEESCSSVDCSKNHFTELFGLSEDIRLEFHIGWIASGTIFFLWDKVFAVAWVAIQGGYNSCLAIGLAVYILSHLVGWVTILSRWHLSCYFGFSGEEYFQNSSFLLWYSLLEQSVSNNLLKSEWQSQTYFLKICLLCVCLVILVRQQTIQKEKRRQRMGLVCLLVLPSSNSFSCWAVKLTMLCLLKLSEHNPSLDCFLLLFTSVSSYDVFMVYFKFQLSWVAQNFMHSFLTYTRMEIPQPHRATCCSVQLPSLCDLFIFFLFLFFPSPYTCS